MTRAKDDTSSLHQRASSLISACRLEMSSCKDYWLARFLILRLIGLLYLIGFVIILIQGTALFGEHGLIPGARLLEGMRPSFSTEIEAVWKYPTIFWFSSTDHAILTAAWAGAILSFLVLIGFANVPILFVLWLLYLSFINIGTLWYGYGWEIQLLETGFLALFMVPLFDPRPFPKMPPPVPIIWLFRWLAFRIYLGAGLIKIRGDQCWRDLTCLYSHYETQPIPGPLSPWFHFMPKIVHRVGTLFNHLVELVVPFFMVGPRRLRILAGVLMVAFQFILILSGNLSFLNWLTIVPIIACFDDAFLTRFFPSWIVKKASIASRNARPLSSGRLIVSMILVVFVAWSSIPVVQNLWSEHQSMNTGFDRFFLVNTYGAFGSVGKERFELILEGTDELAVTDSTVWKPYEFVAKPGDVDRSLPIIAPYQPRIDWQIWFAAMSRPDREPWLIHLVWKLLHNHPGALSLLADNPFPNRSPHWIRIQYYKYQFNPPWEQGPVWTRELIGTWMPALSINTPGFREMVQANGWKP